MMQHRVASALSVTCWCCLANLNHPYLGDRPGHQACAQVLIGSSQDQRLKAHFFRSLELALQRVMY